MNRPPFRADQVGSLLRPQALVDARARFKSGEINAEQLRKHEDEAIRAAVARQESIGLKSVTDGEFRRDYWHIDFLRQLRREPGGQHPVVLFCTVENGVDHIREALDCGAREYIMKPFDSDIVQSKFAQAGLV